MGCVEECDVPKQCGIFNNLEKLAEGELSSEQEAKVFAALDRCAHCLKAFRARLQADPVARRLSQADATIAPLSEGECEQAVDDVRALTNREESRTEVTRLSHDDTQHHRGERPLPNTIAQYRVLEYLGGGGVGDVFKAQHPQLDKIVAVKLLKENMLSDQGAVIRFEREMKAVGRLQHPNIVTATDAGHCENQPYLVMEYVDGSDLKFIVSRRGRFAVAEACEVIRQAAVGLHHAHEKGLVHRDIKPSNLMLNRDGWVKVLDLGLARATFDEKPGEGLTRAGQMFGTFDYMAPEQWESAHQVDGRGDIYSLGCSLYYLLVGNPPFDGEVNGSSSSVLGKMRAHMLDPVPPIRAKRPDIPADLVKIVDRMLAKKPADRFATAEAVAQALEPFCKGARLANLFQPASGATALGVSGEGVGPVSSGELPVYKGGGRKTLVATMAALAVLLLLGVAVGRPYWSKLIFSTSPDTTDPAALAKLNGTGTGSGSTTFPGGATSAGSSDPTASTSKPPGSSGSGTTGTSDTVASVRPGDPPAGTASDAKPATMPGSTTSGTAPPTVASTTPTGSGTTPAISTSPPTTTPAPSKPVPLAFEPVAERSIPELQLFTYPMRLQNAPVSKGKYRFALGGDAPEGAAIDPMSGVFSWQPSEEQGPNEFVVTILADSLDPAFSSGSTTLKLKVLEVNAAPEIATIAPKQVDELAELAFTVAATDTDRPQNVLTYALVDAPEGAKIDPVSGLFTWTPTEEQGPSTVEIKVRVDDDGKPRSLSALRTIMVAVKEVNQPPKWVSSSPAKSKIGPSELVSHTFTATDADLPKTKLKFALEGETAALAKLDPDTGAFRFQPKKDDIGKKYEWTIRATEADGDKPLSITAKFQIEVDRYLSNSLGMKFAFVPAGEFKMGNTDSRPADLGKVDIFDKPKPGGGNPANPFDGLNNPNRPNNPLLKIGQFEDEGPIRSVTLTKSFYLGAYEVTQAEWQAIMEANPSAFSPTGAQKVKVAQLDTTVFPVEQISWDEAVDFCRRLSELPEEKAAGRTYRLPTEAEWEYACRSGTKTRFHSGNDLSSRDANFNGLTAWDNGDTGPNLQRPTKVGAFRANAYGLYDMHGNVSEWCSDWYSPTGYAVSSILVHDPQGPPIDEDSVVRAGMHRVFRGGDWLSISAAQVRASKRDHGKGNQRRTNVGVRILCETPGLPTLKDLAPAAAPKEAATDKTESDQ